MKIMRIGLDLAMCVFEVFGIDHQENPLQRKALKRNKVLAFFSQLEPCIVGIESCGGAHYWGRELRKLGHEVRGFLTEY